MVMICPYKIVVALITVILAAALSMGYVNLNPDPKEKKSWKERGFLFKSAYIFGIVTLIIFHLELFSGGYMCKALFTKAVPMPAEVTADL